MYCIPMAIEESSVVAAAAKSANFWLERGGFHTQIIDVQKVGHVHFIWEGKSSEKLFAFFNSIKDKFYSHTEHITKNMQLRGGGILDIQLVDKTALEPGYYQIHAITTLSTPFIIPLLWVVALYGSISAIRTARQNFSANSKPLISLPSAKLSKGALTSARTKQFGV